MGVTVLGIQHNFYPRSPCGERLSKKAAIGKPTLISIHALLAESDFGLSYFYIIKITISIHALLAESDICAFWMVLSRPLFLSTLSLRRATSSRFGRL